MYICHIDDWTFDCRGWLRNETNLQCHLNVTDDITFFEFTRFFRYDLRSEWEWSEKISRHEQCNGQRQMTITSYHGVVRPPVPLDMPKHPRTCERHNRHQHSAISNSFGESWSDSNLTNSKEQTEYLSTFLDSHTRVLGKYLVTLTKHVFSSQTNYPLWQFLFQSYEIQFNNESIVFIRQQLIAKWKNAWWL